MGSAFSSRNLETYLGSFCGHELTQEVKERLLEQYGIKTVFVARPGEDKPTVYVKHRLIVPVDENNIISNIPYCF